MDRDLITNCVFEVCSEILDVPAESISSETRREDIADFDSLAILQIIAEVCARQDIVLKEETLCNARIERIGDFIDLFLSENG